MADWKDNPNEFAIDVIEHLRIEGNFQIDEHGGDYEEWQTECDALIDEVNATEVKPVVNAFWFWTGDSKQRKELQCSSCGRFVKNHENLEYLEFTETFRYCPRCGAKMDAIYLTVRLEGE